MRKLKYVKLFENFSDDEKYESFTNDEQNTLTALGFKIKGKGIAQIGNDVHDSYFIYKYDLKSDEGKNRLNLYRGNKNFGEYGQFEVYRDDSSFENRSFDHLTDAYNHILSSFYMFHNRKK